MSASVLAPTATAPVSVVTTAYNHADYILTSLTSVLGQEPAPREVIVVDDGSPDDTAARVEPLARAGRVRYVRQANAGMAAARNAGAALATSEYLMFVDDDDVVFPDALARLVAELERHPEAAFAYGEAVVFDREPPPPPAGDDGASRALDPTHILLWNRIKSPGQVLMRRRAFEAVGGFDPSVWGADDWDLWLRLVARYPARRIGRPVLAYRLHAENASRDVARMYRACLRVSRTHLRRLPADRRVVLRRYASSYIRYYHAWQLRTQLRRDLQAGAWGRAASAVGTVAKAWGAELGAYLALKAHLARHGRWELPEDDPVFLAPDLEHVVNTLR